MRAQAEHTTCAGKFTTSGTGPQSSGEGLWVIDDDNRSFWSLSPEEYAPAQMNMRDARKKGRFKSQRRAWLREELRLSVSPMVSRPRRRPFPSCRPRPRRHPFASCRSRPRHPRFCWFWLHVRLINTKLVTKLRCARSPRFVDYHPGLIRYAFGADTR